MFFHKTPTQPIAFLIVGLGNPGKKYENTRHNAGFMALDALAAQQGASLTQLKFKGLCGEATIGGSRALLLKPDTFMNLSGQAVCAAMQFYKLPPEQVLVLYDDISLEPGTLRIRAKGSHGGHNGMKSIVTLSGADTFPRIKLGIGKKPHPDYDLADWVLSRFTTSEIDCMQQACKKAAEAAALILAQDMTKAMNLYND